MNHLDWTYLLLALGDALIPIALMLLVCAILAVFVLVSRWFNARLAEEYAAGYQLGSLHGARAERRIALEETESDALYPVIVETLPDGSKRRVLP